VTSSEVHHFIWDNLEETLVSPVLIPGVHDQEVVNTILDTPANDLDGMTTESFSALVLVNTALVAQEVLIDCECTGDWTIGVDILLEMINVRDGVRPRRGHVFVLFVGGLVSRLARSSALRRLLSDVSAAWLAAWNVMLTLGHGVRVASGSVTHLAASDDTSLVEPVPWGTDLTTVATHGAALHKSAATSSISSGEESVETILDAVSVVEGLSGTESPAGSAVGLVSDLTDLGALGPVGSGIEVLWERIRVHAHVTFGDIVHPVFVDNRTEGLSHIGGLGFEESVVLTSVPSSFHRVNSSDVLIMINDEVLEIINAHLDLGADLFIRDVG